MSYGTICHTSKQIMFIKPIEIKIRIIVIVKKQVQMFFTQIVFIKRWNLVRSSSLPSSLLEIPQYRNARMMFSSSMLSQALLIQILLRWLAKNTVLISFCSLHPLHLLGLQVILKGLVDRYIKRLCDRSTAGRNVQRSVQRWLAICFTSSLMWGR